MRGEYKVPGGKLVAVDVEVADGRLVRPSVHGDFFLEPDDALDDILRALDGLPEESSVSDIRQAVNESLRPEARLIGFDSEAIGVAVRRALGSASRWEDLTFDVIRPVKLDPKLHVALDEVIAKRVARGEANPNFRFWDWERPLVVIGSFQSYRNEIDDEARAKYGIEVVRRITGGGAMFMEEGNCITYSLLVPGSLVEGLSYEQSYKYLDTWAIGALAELGVNARYVPLNDIASDKGKIGGAAQRRLVNGTVLHHVTASYDIDADKMLKVLRIGREKLSDKGIKSANKRVDPMRSQTGMTREAIIDSFLAYFEKQYRCVERDYTQDELDEAAELVHTKFSTEQWVKRVP